MINHKEAINKTKISHPSASNAWMKVLVGPKEGWSDYVMREVEVQEGGYTPKHAHPWPHINVMLEGEGEVLQDGKYVKVSPGSFAYIEPNMEHQYRNTGKTPFRFICIVPKEGHLG